MVGQTSDATLAVKIVSAGSAACIADLFTFPLDVAKVRLQVQGEGNSAKATGVLIRSAPTLRYKGIFGTLLTIAQQEGPRSLYGGLNAGLQRQLCFASVRIGLYDNVKAYYSQKLGGSAQNSSVGVRILAGITTGGMAVICAQPTDVVKVRMQAQGIGGAVKRYTGALHAYKTIGKQEGVKGLWKGTLPNVARNAIVNAAELVCYDSVKDFLLSRQLMKDAMPCHFVSAFGAGFCATVIASPVDVVKTRFMNSAAGRYSGALDCALKMYHEGGLRAFYKGFMPSYVRLGSWNIVMFVTFEQLKLFFTHMSESSKAKDLLVPLRPAAAALVTPAAYVHPVRWEAPLKVVNEPRWLNQEQFTLFDDV